MAEHKRGSWSTTKKWSEMYIRSEKLRRARQLNMDYPRTSQRERVKDEMLNLLFICSKNKWRSPTAEKIYKNHSLVDSRSAGTASSARRRVTANDIKWSDIIIVMEHKHLSKLKSEFPGEMKYKESHVLDIPDDFKFMDPELIDEIRQSVDSIIG